MEGLNYIPLFEACSTCTWLSVVELIANLQGRLVCKKPNSVFMYARKIIEPRIVTMDVCNRV